MTDTMSAVSGNAPETPQPPVAPSESAPAGALPSIDDIIRPTTAVAQSQRRSSSSLLRVLLSILIPLVVAVIILIVGELWYRATAASSIRHAVAAGFGVAESDVSVDLGPDLALVDLINGSFPVVKATVHDVDLGGVGADGVVVATEVPIDRTLPVGALTADFTVTPDGVGTLITKSLALTPTKTTVADGEIDIDTNLDLGIVGQFPASLVLKPSAGPSSVTLDPTTLVLGNRTINVSNVLDVPIVGNFIAPLLSAKEVCIAGSVPQELTIQRFAITKGAVHVTLSGQGVPLDETLARHGACTS